MSPVTLANLAAWCIQTALIVGAGLTTLWLVRLEAPAVRYLFLRALLVICLTLPLVQPRPAVELNRERGTLGGVSIAVVPAQAGAATTAAGAHGLLPWASAIAAVVLFGAVARMMWIAAGIVKLRRLRRAGAVAEASADHEDLQRVIAARATIRYVRGLAQPVTFGFLAPVILLPSTVRDQPASIQRAVLAHELWHVRRRDWLWTLCEEGLRAAVWFHPAIWSLLSRIQSAREEVVDELTVLTTGSRRTYVNALLAFADSSPSMAAPAFARRKHLVRRLVLISKEAVMSGRRVAASSAALGAVVLFTGWYSVQAFPMRGEQQLPADAAAVVPGSLERQAKPITPENPIPRRTYNVPAADPAGLEEIGAGGTVTMRITLDTTGHVAETRAVRVMYRQKDSLTMSIPDPTRENLDRMAQGTYKGSSSDKSISMQKAAEHVEAMIGSATQAVRQWQYAPPADGPIAFNVPIALRRATTTAAAATRGDGFRWSKDATAATTPAASHELTAGPVAGGAATPTPTSSARLGEPGRERSATAGGRHHQGADQAEEREPRLSAGGAGDEGPGRRHHRGSHRARRHRQPGARAAVHPDAGRRRGGGREAVGVHADAAERRADPGHDDGHGELHTAVRLF